MARTSKSERMCNDGECVRQETGSKKKGGETTYVHRRRSGLAESGSASGGENLSFFSAFYIFE